MECNGINVLDITELGRNVQAGDKIIVVTGGSTPTTRIFDAIAFKGDKGETGIGLKGDPGPAGRNLVLSGFKGPWESDYEGGYSFGDIVFHDGNYYISLVDANTAATTDDTKWAVFTVQLLGSEDNNINKIIDGSIASNATVTIDYPTGITIEYPNGVTKQFTPTGIFERDEDGVLLTQVDAVGVWNGTNDKITYSSGPILEIDGLTGVEMSYATFAKKDQANVFEKTNTFQGLTRFEGQVSMPLIRIPNDVSTIDASKGGVHKMVFTSVGTKNIIGTNLVPGQAIFLYVVVASGVSDITVQFQNGNFTGVDAGVSFVPHGSTGSFSLTTGIWVFGLVTVETGIHILGPKKSDIIS